MQQINASALSPADAEHLLNMECQLATRAEMAAGIACGPAKRRMVRYVHIHRANIAALADRAFGPAPDLSTIDDDELLAELLN